MNITDIIKNSFERWYNKNIAKEEPVSITINYSDTQTLAIKAYHTVCIALQALVIKDNEPDIVPLITLRENYNHGVTSEEEAKEHMYTRLLEKMYSFKD